MGTHPEAKLKALDWLFKALLGLALVPVVLLLLVALIGQR